MHHRRIARTSYDRPSRLPPQARHRHPVDQFLVQPETTPSAAGVTNHIGRIHIGDLPLTNDTEFERMVEASGPISTARSIA